MHMLSWALGKFSEPLVASLSMAFYKLNERIDVIIANDLLYNFVILFTGIEQSKKTIFTEYWNHMSNCLSDWEFLIK